MRYSLNLIELARKRLLDVDLLHHSFVFTSHLFHSTFVVVTLRHLFVVRCHIAQFPVRESPTLYQFSTLNISQVTFFFQISLSVVYLLPHQKLIILI